ncbi:protein phosphatase CheZ [Roseicella aerolata]|uniref:Protein phosphatase CheZ n=1 Tax=Roseicella aerolata TaxID=2883479 RepID=A0A9X1ID11_9PROT|nr:protein phosphatase CheZ [Roseicella aerolata]MCB4822561.1 protein phosphatase CheZ [Roseicella aerolata]
MQTPSPGPAPAAELTAQFDSLRQFIDRRIAELSAELHATVQLVDDSEANLSAQLARIHAQIAGLVAIPAAGTRNSGVELEAVVQATEAAATTILEAAEAIQSWIEDGAQDRVALQALSARVSSIFEACSFQDVTGQRIRRAIQHLQQVETMLQGLIPPQAAPPEAGRVTVRALAATVPDPATAGPDLGQSEIDRLLNG